ncbi:MAG: ATP-binding cassette domain-containing protein [Alphaproteobacteria bacterium]|jgi:thiamine transport system ATP-binding protein
MLKIDKLTCSFGSFNTNFSFKILNSGIVGVVGRSGSGKSTLLNLIAGFIEPQSGKIIYNDSNLNDLEPSQRDLSILFQNFNNFDHLSIFENIILGIDPQMKKTTDNFRIVRDILKKLSINLDMETKLNLLSGGEQQRVSIARCLIRKKSLLLLDEPFNSLDPGLRNNLYKDVVSMAKKTPNQLTLISSHLIEELKKITNSFIFLHKGRIVGNKVLTFEELSKYKSFKDYLK